MDTQAYDRFEKKLKKFLVTDINYDILCNFLRQESQLQKCFQIRHNYNGSDRYIGAEKAYAYEHTSSYKINESTTDQLLSEIDEYEFYSEPMEGKISLNKFNDYFKTNKINFHDKNSLNKLVEELDCPHMRKNEILTALFEFCNLEPKLPGKDKIFIKTEPIKITNEMDRESIISYLKSIRDKNPTADLAFYSYRDFSNTDWKPFLKAAVERNPVSIIACEKFSDTEVINILESISNQSIYDSTRVAQPDEVWNYRRGDGLERAICLANILKSRNQNLTIDITVEKEHVDIIIDGAKITWPSLKGLKGNIKLDESSF
jgi:hypothetical protein